MYSEKVMDHFNNPRNVGEIENPSGVGTVGNAKCGDIMRMYLDIDDNGIIQEAKFKTFGCGAAVATSSMATELVKGKTIQEALQVTNKAVMEALDGLPPVKVHCSLLAEEAIHAALWDYAEKHNIRIEGLERPVNDISEKEEAPEEEHEMKEKAVVGMSGGVDSSVAAYLLKEQGYDVIGVTMQIWQDQDVFVQSQEGGCCGLSAVDDARRVAERLEIPYYVMNFREDFQKYVIDYFVSEYEKARTPNPCIACNRYVKWESLLHRSLEIGADYIATGHYARIMQLPNGRYTIRNSVTAAKDQTYALYNLTQEQLSHTLMPVGDYDKPHIRQIAEEIGLPVATKHDSQDICFVPDHDYASFIAQETGKESMPGNFVDEEGNVMGQHRGLIHYTIGQRKGLGISSTTPIFVRELRPETNEVVLCKSESLFSHDCHVDNINYMAEEKLTEPVRAIGKIRYSHAGAPCTLYPQPDGTLLAQFDEPQRAMTPGQAAVFYQDDHVLCGGTIEKE